MGFRTREEAEAFLQAFSLVSRGHEIDGSDSANSSNDDMPSPKRGARTAITPARDGINTRSKSGHMSGAVASRRSPDVGTDEGEKGVKGRTQEKRRRNWQGSQKKKGDVENGMARLKINIDMPTA